MLVVWLYAVLHQVEGLLHMTSIAFSLARGLSHIDRLLLSVHKNIAWIPMLKQDLACALGIMRRARDVEQYSQTQPEGNRGREEENADQFAAAKGVKWKKKKKKQTSCPRGTSKYASGTVQMPTDETPRRKLQHPFKYGKSDTIVMSKLRARKPTRTTKSRQKAVTRPSWWNKETQAAWTDKRAMVTLCQKRKKSYY